MTEDLKMTGDDYNVALFTFFITYILFEVRLLIFVFKALLRGKHTLRGLKLLAPPYRPSRCHVFSESH